MCLFWTACASKYLTVCLKLKKYFEYKMYLYGKLKSANAKQCILHEWWYKNCLCMAHVQLPIELRKWFRFSTRFSGIHVS